MTYHRTFLLIEHDRLDRIESPWHVHKSPHRNGRVIANIVVRIGEKKDAHHCPSDRQAVVVIGVRSQPKIREYFHAREIVLVFVRCDTE